LEALDARITNAIRCVPSGNWPANDFLRSEIAAMPRLKVILAPGSSRPQGNLLRPEASTPIPLFSHGASFAIGGGFTLLDSYHCSPQNVATGRLSADKFDSLLTDIRRRID